MNIKRFIVILLTAAVFFIAGFAVGRFVMPRQVHITVVDVDSLTTLIEKYNAQADKIREEFKAMKEWNKNSLVIPPGFLREKEEKGTEEPRK